MSKKRVFKGIKGLVDDRESGSAHLVIKLDDSTITVLHGTLDSVLGKGRVKRGAWDELWACLKKVGVQGLE